jgi:hypothetical protein
MAPMLSFYGHGIHGRHGKYKIAFLDREYTEGIEGNYRRSNSLFFGHGIHGKYKIAFLDTEYTEGIEGNYRLSNSLSFLTRTCLLADRKYGRHGKHTFAGFFYSSLKKKG